jgi:hypothetical protein
MKSSVFLAILCCCLSAACYAQGAASVLFSSGQAQIVDRDGQSRAARRGAELSVGETVDTADGRVQLRFRDGAQVSLQTATRFRVDEFRFVEQNGQAGPEDRGFFALLKGGFRTLSGLLGKTRRDQYKVDAVVATIGIRGTEYAAQLNDGGLTVSTFEGLVEVCSAVACAQVGPGQTVVVADGSSVPGLRNPAPSGAGEAPLAPDLLPQKNVELPPLTVPAQTPAANVPPPLSPTYSPPTGPYR